jgi:anti-sigma regulatory factor (Ser/Thr protein kinase)
VSAARRFVRDVLRGQSRDLLDAVELMASELATNAIHHARTAFELAIEDGQGRIRVEVRDAGQGRPVPRSPAPYEQTGRGLRIVEAMSESWGVDLGSHGKTVWFTVPQQQPC